MLESLEARAMLAAGITVSADEPSYIEGQSARFNVTLTKPASGEIAIEYQLSGGPAGPSKGTAVFAKGTKATQIAVPTEDNLTPGDGYQLKLDITAIDGSSPAPYAAASALILDNDGSEGPAGPGSPDMNTSSLGPGPGDPTGPAELDLYSWETIVVNDDDDDQDGILDRDDLYVPGEDDLEVSVFAVVNPQGSELEGWTVRFETTGPIRLWMFPDKREEVESGSVYPANNYPSFDVEATGVGSGGITARLFYPSGNLAAVASWAMAAVPLDVRRDGVKLTAQQDVWVGEKINLEIVGGDPAINFKCLGVDRAIKNYDPTDAIGQVEYLQPTDLDGREVHFHWVVAHFEHVRASVERTDPRFPSRWANRHAFFDVKRPAADATSVTTTVTANEVATEVATKRVLEFGTRSNPNPLLQTEGITFTWHADAAAPQGQYRWIQLIDSTEIWTKGGVQWWRTTGGLVLDTAYPASDANPFPDSPYTAWSTFFEPDPVTATERSDSFQTYLMWKPSKPGAIFVPLRVTNWWWTGSASMHAVGGWTLDTSPDAHSQNPASQNTTQFPEWTRKYPDVMVEQPYG
jgi:hypothetical protein